MVAQGKALGARISLFMDPNTAAMAAAQAIGADRVELYTEPFAAAWHGPDHVAQLERYRRPPWPRGRWAWV